MNQTIVNCVPSLVLTQSWSNTVTLVNLVVYFFWINLKFFWQHFTARFLGDLIAGLIWLIYVMYSWQYGFFSGTAVDYQPHCSSFLVMYNSF